MSDYFQDYTRQLRDSLHNTSSLGRLSGWIEAKTTLAGKPFSFTGHEFQRDIVDSTHNNAVIIKPSQTGVTELGARFKLAFLATEQDTVAMYILPTAHEAVRAVKSRFDTIIRGSKTLSSLLHTGSDSASFKQIGSSQFFSAGSHGKAIISIPTDLLSVDERNFCNSETVSTAESRLTHSRFVNEETGARGIKRSWSTPTAVNAGVDGLYQQSNQLKRLVKCKQCSTWFWPTFLEHVTVSGWDRPMKELDHNEALSLETRGLLSSAKLLCPSCHNPITANNLGPEYREWVATYPSRKYIEGWWVNPFDLPSYHTPESILRKLIDYRNNYGHFVNFVLGHAYSDASNSIIDEKVETFTSVKPISPVDAELGSVSGCIMGMDVGKTSWITIAKPNFSTNSLDIVWVEAIKLGGEEYDDLKTKVILRMRQYGVVLLVCDSLPYTPSILAIQASMPEGFVLPNSYTLRDTKLPMYVINKKDQSVATHRTKTLNLMVKKVNKGDIRWPNSPEMLTVRKHLQGSCRVDRVLDDGSEESDWVKTGADHYFHAVNYLSIAQELLNDSSITGWSPVPTIHEVMVGSKHQD